MSNKPSQIKVLAASLLLATSWQASAAIGGLQVQSGLNEPFSATVVVTGDEARALASGRPTISGADLTASVLQQSGDRAVIRVQSAAPIKEPMLTFWLGVGNQNRQYTAMLDPRDYRAPTQASGGRERTAPAAASGRERPVAEQTATRPARAETAQRPQRERVRSSERRAAPAATIEISGTAYQVKDGELLVNIAERVQPSGMTLRQTINALVRANPRSFRNGNPDLMYRGATLIIPDAAQLRRLAQNPHLRVRPVSAAGLPAANLPERATQSAQPATPPASEKPADTAPAKPVTPPPAPPVEPAKPVEPAQPVQAETPPASAEKPVTQVVDVPPAVSEVPASVPAASDPLQVASEPMAASVAVSEPVAPPVTETPPAPQPAAPTETTEPVEEESGGLMQWLPYGAGALVLGGLAYFLLQRRRKSGGDEALGQEANEDELFFDDAQQDGVVAASAATAAAATVAADDDELHLDLSHLADQHLGNTPDSGFAAAQPAAAADAAADDWGWIEESSNQTQAASPAANVAVTSDEEAWLDFGEETVAVAAAPAAAAAVQTEVDEDLSWVLDVEETPVAAPASEPVRQAAPVAAADDDWLSGLDEVVVEETVAPQAAASAAAVAALDDQWDMNIDLSEPEVQAAPAVETAGNGFDSFAENLDFNLNFADEQPAVPAAPAATESFEAPAFDAFSSQAFAAEEVMSLNLDMDASESAVAAPAAALPQEALEAKLELARMYLEIDDANTARQTLMELVNESEGSSIQAQAKALLQELS